MIKRLQAAWRYGRMVPYDERGDAPNFWTSEDSMWLAGILQSHNGKKLRLKLTNLATQVACNAVRNPVNTDYNCGAGAGVFIAISALETLANVSAPEQEQQELKVV